MSFTVDDVLRTMWADRYVTCTTAPLVAFGDTHVSTHKGLPHQRGASIRKLKKLAYRRGYTRHYLYQGDFE